MVEVCAWQKKQSMERLSTVRYLTGMAGGEDTRRKVAGDETEEEGKDQDQL